jgi:mRNA-degrading endonuclease RelE of RelBE toxin-antitoxin system
LIPLPYTLHILAHAERDLKSITKSAPSSGVVIAAEIRKLPAYPRPSGYSPVIGQKGLFRVHAAKKYRVIYSILDELRAVMIVAVRPKGKDTYKNIPVIDLVLKIKELEKIVK